MNETEERTRRRLRTRLQRDVPPAIRAYKWQGGPSSEDYERVRGYACAFGEVILYPDGKGSEEPLLQKLVDGVAVLSFCPGGIRLFGIEFEADTVELDPHQNELR